MFSIIIPTCNRVSLLDICLQHVERAKQYAQLPVEVIVTDDSKTTDTQLFIQEKYNWVKWIKGPQKGPAANRNNGAKNAQFNWLMFLDDDCEPDENIIRAYENAIATNTTIKVFEGAITCNEGFTSPLHWAPVNTTGGKLWSCNFLIQKKTFFEINGFDENFPHPHMEDNDFAKQLKQKNINFLFVNSALVNHPPRKLHDAKKIASLQESLFYFNYKHSKKQPSKKELLLGVSKLHLSLIKNNFFSKDIFKAFFLLIGILFFLNKYIPNWENKYER